MRSIPQVTLDLVASAPSRSPPACRPRAFPLHAVHNPLPKYRPTKFFTLTRAFETVDRTVACSTPERRPLFLESPSRSRSTSAARSFSGSMRRPSSNAGGSVAESNSCGSALRLQSARLLHRVFRTAPAMGDRGTHSP